MRKKLMNIFTVSLGVLLSIALICTMIVIGLLPFLVLETFIGLSLVIAFLISIAGFIFIELIFGSGLVLLWLSIKETMEKNKNGE